MPRLLLSAILTGTLLTMTYCTLAADTTAAHTSPQYADGKFRNPVAMREHSFGEQVGLFWTFMFNKPAGTQPRQAVPVHSLSRAQLLAAPDNTMFRLGHSTLLFKFGGAFYLTDPVFSERASPVQWAGPARRNSLSRRRRSSRSFKSTM